MRLSTSMMHELSMRGVHRQQSEQVSLQEQVALGRRITKPSDDPVGAAAVVNVQTAKAQNLQWQTNAQNAEAALLVEEQALADATRVLQDIKTLAVQAGNAALQNSDRASIATQMQGLSDELLGIANRTDGKGTYIFAGYQGGTQPFTQSAPGVVTYNGDEGERLLQVGPQRRIAIGDSGVEVFGRIREGNGTFVASPGGSNTGTAIVDTGRVRDPAAWENASNSRNYSVHFHIDSCVTPPVTTYDIVDDTSNVSMLTGAAPVAGPHARTYSSGATIPLSRQAGDPSAVAWNAGVEVSVTGAPASGDTFAIDSAPNQDVFTTINEMVTALRAGLNSDATRASFQNSINRAGASLDRAVDSVLTARSATGSRLQELDALRSATADLDVNYDADLSRLQDLDFAQALSDLARRQTSLEAAQKSYVAISRLRLFDFL